MLKFSHEKLPREKFSTSSLWEIIDRRILANEHHIVDSPSHCVTKLSRNLELNNKEYYKSNQLLEMARVLNLHELLQPGYLSHQRIRIHHLRCSFSQSWFSIVDYELRMQAKRSHCLNWSHLIFEQIRT